MTQKDLIDAIAETTGSTKKVTAEFISAFTTVVQNKVAEGEQVKLMGFGSWERVEKAERPGRNVKTGEVITIAARKSPKFKFGKEFKQLVKNS